MSYNFRNVRRTVYALKRLYPQILDLYKTTGDNTDPGTGLYTSTMSKLTLKVVLLPNKKLRAFSYDLAFIAANKNFTYGGFYDTNARDVIIDRRDLGNFPVDLNCYAIFDKKAWRPKQLAEIDQAEAIILKLEALDGGTYTQIINAYAKSRIGFTDSAGHA